MTGPPHNTGFFLFLLFLFLLFADAEEEVDPRPDPTVYGIGAGIYDVTGPVAGVNMMGYADPAQINAGLHTRLYSRAFVVDDSRRRVVFVSVDCGMMAEAVRHKVLQDLRGLYGDTYGEANVILSGTHTHSGPAGYQQYLLYDITSQGFVKETFDAMVQGIVKSIQRAHDSVQQGRIYINAGQVLNASVNRSPTSYLYNPEDERAQYDHDTDKTMTLLRMEALDGTPIGTLNWFAVHPTSMNKSNVLVSSDNKGFASMRFEAQMNPKGTLPGQGNFVAAFAQSNCGDVSPNTRGPHCLDSGAPCHPETSTCGGRVQMCVASGPGRDMVESTQIIGERQFQAAWELYHNESSTPLSGPVQFIHHFVDMGNVTVTLDSGATVQTCPPALGYSFAAGTTDGPGGFDFTQGMTEGTPFWNMVSGFLHSPEPEQIRCHAPKPILLDTAHMNMPYPWHPRVVDTQVGRIGQLIVAAVPGEFTTMCGRRLRQKMASAAAASGLEGAVPVLAGLSNVYSHYVATWEEYQAQRYEAASTIYGPDTCAAYRQIYGELVTAIMQDDAMPPGPTPPDLLPDQMSLLPDVIFDGAPLGRHFGEVVAQPFPLVYTGETVSVKFVAGHPRNTRGPGGSFLTVERLEGGSAADDDANWVTVATDANWSTRFEWKRTSTLLGHSLATVRWSVPEDGPQGFYRITHSGHQKDLFRGVKPYRGVSKTFEVVLRPSREDVNIGDAWWENLLRRR
ncbi:neutral ceramidase [Oratosquilla oratoria]|uniref:neutral ceramidase n=1 Tax=Oratosquilla oratoria TaxID=337810 RepID=UPI003F75810A